MNPYQTDIPLAMRPLTGAAMMPSAANGIMILSTILLFVIGGITIGAIFLSAALPNLLGATMAPTAITLTKVVLSTLVLGGIVGTIIGGIIIWRREAAGYDGCGRFHKRLKRHGSGNPPDDYEDLEANRSSSSVPSRTRPCYNSDYYDPYYAAAYENADRSDIYDSDSSESFTYDPDPYVFSPYKQYNLHEVHSYINMHNTSRDDRSSNPDGPVSHQRPYRAPSNMNLSYDSDPYTSDLYEDGYEADSDSSPYSPPTPSDRAPLLQTTVRGPRYS